MSRRTGCFSETRAVKLGFRECMITIVKNESDVNISSVKTCRVACYSGKCLSSFL